MLRERRELRGLTLQDAHAHTRVPIEYLRALEAGNLQALPVSTYAVGFLSTYCQFLDLEPEYFADRLRACAPSVAAPVSQNSEGRFEPVEFKLRPRWVNEAIAWAGVCAFLLVCWLAYTVMFKPLVVETGTRVQAGTIEITPPTHFEEDF